MTISKAISIFLVLGLASFGCGESVDSGAPDAPVLNEVASPTNQNPLTLTGVGAGDATVQVRGRAQAVVSGRVSGSGSFTVSVPLHANTKNLLIVSLVAANGKESPVTVVEVLHDDIPPATPVLSPVTSPTRVASQNVRGTTEPGATVLITGGAAEATGTANAAGEFDVNVPLNTALSGPVRNTLQVIARDAAGNESDPAAAAIDFDASLPVQAPEVDAFPRYTNQLMIALTGNAEAGTGISVVGGAEPASAATSGQGRFSVSVSLRENANHTLYVFTVGSGQTSPPTVVEVTQDSVPPEAPSVEPTVSPTGATEITLTGQAEPHSTIKVSGGKTPASAPTDDSGRYSVRVTLHKDQANELEITATDRAGNQSEPTTLSVTQDSHLEQPVQVITPPSPTRHDVITLSGKTQPDAVVHVTGGLSDVSTTTLSDGTFTVDVELNPNATNELIVRRDGGTTDTLLVVVHDSIPPVSPTVNAVATPTNRRTFPLTGTSEPGATIGVSGGVSAASGSVGSSAQFSVPVTIAEDATTTLLVIATDLAGNSSAPISVTVTHSSQVPDAPVVDNASPAPTSQDTYTVTGRVTQPAAGASITITGGSGDATGPTDASTGAFAVSVELKQNQLNELRVTSKNGAIVSPATPVSILHDNVPPEAPDTSKITIGSGSSLCITRGSVTVTGAAGSVESRSRVRITNLTTNAAVTATASDGGAFNTSIAACSGENLRFVAIDAANNESPAATKKTP